MCLRKNMPPESQGQGHKTDNADVILKDLRQGIYIPNMNTGPCCLV